MKLFADFEFNGQIELETIEFGAILTDDLCNQISSFKMYVKPNYKITNHVEKITNITNELVKEALNFKDVLFSFKRWIKENSDNKKIEMYAWGEDWKQLRKEAKSKGCLDLFDEITKNNELINYQRAVSLKTLYNRDLLTKSLALEDVLSLYDLGNEVTHDALNDALDVKRIYKAIEINKQNMNRNELLRIYQEKQKHIQYMKEQKEKQTLNMFKDLLTIYQNKVISIDYKAFRTLKSGPGCFFNEIERDIDNTNIFSRKRECDYEENTVKLIISLRIIQNTIQVIFKVLHNNDYIGNHEFIVDDNTRKFVSNFLKENSNKL